MPRLSAAKLAQLIELRADGMPATKVASKLGISPRTVQKRWADHIATSTDEPTETSSDQVEISSVTAAVQSGDEVAVLKATIAEVAARIDSPATTGAEIASLAKQLPILWARLADITPTKEVDPVDDIVGPTPGRRAATKKARGPRRRK